MGGLRATSTTTAKSTVPTAPSNVGFSNRPFRVKRFQTIPLGQKIEAVEGIVPVGVASSGGVPRSK
jgi:hypothetical protein